MQVNHIRYFVALCEECNFTRAGRRCGVSQPTVTNAVKKLERDIGGRLFYRKPVVALTALGRALRPYLSRIVEEADLAMAAAARVNAETTDPSAVPEKRAA